MPMAETGDEISVEVNAPPSIAIDVGGVVAVQPVTLSGGINAGSQNLFQEAQPQNVNFVMGPNGQLIAVLKPTFVWKHFAIGGGIPFALYFIPLLLLMILNPGYDDYSTKKVTLNLEEGTTTYSGDFQTPSGHEFEYCWFDNMNDDMEQFECQPTSGNSANIEYRSDDGTYIAGWWNNSNGVIIFDNGTDFGESITMQFEYRDSDPDSEILLRGIEEIMGLTCCLGFLLSIVMLIVGFSTGKPGMGWGGVTSLLLLPFTGILGLGTLW
jgi:hypothetical protein